MFDYFLLKARLFESECQAIILLRKFFIFLWNLVKKRTFCQKGRPLKKKGQNVSFTELKDKKGRIDSLDDVDRRNKTKKNKTNKTKQNKTISTP